MSDVLKIYNVLLQKYGSQGWWPIVSRANSEGFDNKGYAPSQYDHPSTAKERFEVIIGSMLTQNTAWTNVEKALEELHQKNLITPSSIIKADHDVLSSAIRSAGYFNQKAKRLKIVSEYFREEHSDDYKRFLTSDIHTLRSELLTVNGIGPETADSILLYAFHRASFVVDAYTRRIFSRVGLVKKDQDYNQIKLFFESSLPKDTSLFKEYHALIVEHAKRHCKTKPVCEGCPVEKVCKKRI